jgi:hypothetical protein
VDWAAKKYNFAQKEQEVNAQRQKERDDKIRNDAIAERDRFYAERQANPALRQAESSAFSTVNKAVQAGKIPDPLSYASKEERHRATTELINRDIREREQVQ